MVTHQAFPLYVTIMKVYIHKVVDKIMCPFIYSTFIEYLLRAKDISNTEGKQAVLGRVPALKELQVFPGEIDIYWEWKNFGLLGNSLN